jgi:hypothetical protein
MSTTSKLMNSILGFCGVLNETGKVMTPTSFFFYHHSPKEASLTLSIAFLGFVGC